MDEVITILGKEMPIGEALDAVVKNIQEILNNTHCATRQIVFLPDTVEESFKKSYELSNDIIDMTEQLKQLLSELKRVMGKIPFKAESNEEKEWVRDYNNKRKEDRKNVKVELK